MELRGKGNRQEEKVVQACAEKPGGDPNPEVSFLCASPVAQSRVRQFNVKRQSTGSRNQSQAIANYTPMRSHYCSFRHILDNFDFICSQESSSPRQTHRREGNKKVHDVDSD